MGDHLDMSNRVYNCMFGFSRNILGYLAQFERTLCKFQLGV